MSDKNGVIYFSVLRPIKKVFFIAKTVSAHRSFSYTVLHISFVSLDYRLSPSPSNRHLLLHSPSRGLFWSTVSAITVPITRPVCSLIFFRPPLFYAILKRFSCSSVRLPYSPTPRHKYFPWFSTWFFPSKVSVITISTTHSIVCSLSLFFSHTLSHSTHCIRVSLGRPFDVFLGHRPIRIDKTLSYLRYGALYKLTYYMSLPNMIVGYLERVLFSCVSYIMCVLV